MGRVIGEISIGGKSIRLVEEASDMILMDIYNSRGGYSLHLNTEMMTGLRHLLRMGCRITRRNEDRRRR